MQRNSITTSRTHVRSTSWINCLEFCLWITLAPNLSGIPEPTPQLKISTEWVRVGLLSVNCEQVRNHMVEVYFHNLAQIFDGVEAKYPHLEKLGKISFWSGRILRTYSRVYPTPNQVVPIPISLLHEFWRCLHEGDSHQCVIFGLFYISFFSLCRSSKYCKGGSNIRFPPSRLIGIKFYISSCHLCIT